jgi:hypothetical protein
VVEQHPDGDPGIDVDPGHERGDRVLETEGTLGRQLEHERGKEGLADARDREGRVRGDLDLGRDVGQAGHAGPHRSVGKDDRRRHAGDAERCAQLVEGKLERPDDSSPCGG